MHYPPKKSIHSEWEACEIFSTTWNQFKIKCEHEREWEKENKNRNDQTAKHLSACYLNTCL